MFSFLAAKLISVLTLLVIWLSPADFYNSFFNCVAAAVSPSPDAIAIRVIPNPENLSSIKWYKANVKIQGSPQARTVDGYEAIRDGRTVYVNAANIDLANDIFYNNIYLLSFSQNAEKATEDIFGQLLSRWKFNTNIIDQNQKNKIRNDSKRLSDLTEIKQALINYKNSHGSYPKISSGSYLAGKTISVWPSWQATLGAELGINLPLDPINKLGPCPNGYHPITCWNQTDKKFATDLNQAILPTGSRIYFYSVGSKGENIKLCSQMETNYSNITPFNCFVDQLPNSAPVITGVNLVGWPTQPFTGFIRVSDPDGDNLSYGVELIEPADNLRWTNDYLWQWEPGANGFIVKKSKVAGQIIVSAAKAGKASRPGTYKIKFTVNDGKNQANSIVSQILEVQIHPYSMNLTNVVDNILIGENKDYSLTGFDTSKQPITNLLVRDFFLDGSVVNMAAHGFSLNGMSLSEKFTAKQRPGLYIVNVYAVDPTTDNTVDSFFKINLIDHPPVINSIVAKYANNMQQTYSVNQPFIIDNEEPAIIQVAASDPDQGHIVKYELVDNNTELAINRDSGVITGLESLNYHASTDRTYNIKVRAFDQYYVQSNSEECSVEAIFNLTVRKFCSLDVAETVNLPGPYKIDNPGQKINIGNSLLDCSEVGRGKVDVSYNGTIRSRAIVFVLDLSGSMNTNVDGSPAVSQMKQALIENNGIFDKLHAVASSMPPGRFIKIGLVGFNSAVYPYPKNLQMINIAGPGESANFKSEVEFYQADGGTNTLAALNKAEQMLATVTGVEIDKYIVLMSDGIPTVVRESVGVIEQGYCALLPCPCNAPRDDDGNCLPAPACSPSCSSSQYCYCGQCFAYSPPCPPDTPCGTYPNCSARTTCCDGSQRCGTCPPNLCPTLNNNVPRLTIISIFSDFFSRLFAPTPALAITQQTQCLATPTGLSCVSCDSPYYNADCYVGLRDLNCDISLDVAVEAEALKNAGVKIYSIYYNTTGTQQPAVNMRAWSSDNGSMAGEYFFTGMNIGKMFDEVLSGIAEKPKDVNIEGVAIEDTMPYYSFNTITDVDISSALSCGKTELTVDFLPSPPGFLEFSHLRFNYCPAKLHP